jgi:acyl carrier protein
MIAKRKATGMSSATMEAELRELLGRVAKADTSRLQLDDDLHAVLGIDSLAGLRLLAAVENQYGVRFSDQQLDSCRTMRQILEFIATDQRESAS